MTARLLVSVRSASEAEICVAAGVDIIDVKEPNRGGLGSAGCEVWRAVGKAIPPGYVASAAMGELSEREPALSGEEVESLAAFQYAKVGLADSASDWRGDWLRWRDSLPGHIQPVAVAYADWRNCAAPAPNELLDFAAKRAPILLVDTCEKTNGPVDYGNDELKALAEACRAAKVQFALAGGLTRQSLRPAIAAVSPDIVAVRGAACEGERTGDITSGDRIVQLQATLRMGA